MRYSLILSAVAALTVPCLPAFPADVKDYYEIVDLATMAKVQAPFVNNLNTRERVLGNNDGRNVFYALRETRDTFVLRTISYEGTVIEEKTLTGFHCRRFFYGPKNACLISPNGALLLFLDDEGKGVCSYDVGSAAAAPLVPQLSKSVCWMGWLSDGQVIVSVGGPGDPAQPHSNGFLVADVKTRQAEQIYQDASLAFGGGLCSLSPDRKSLAFFAEKIHQLQVIDLRTREVITVTPREEMEIEHLCWSPDSKLLAYEAPIRGRIKVYSLAERKEVLIKDKGDIDENLLMPASMFFLDNERLAVQPYLPFIEGVGPKDILECGSGGICKAPVFAVHVATGNVEKPFPEDFRGVIRPLAGGKKFLGVADDDRDNNSEPGVATVSVPEAISALPAAVGSALGAVKQALSSPPGIEIFDCDTGQKMKVNPPAGCWEMITTVDNASGCFHTIAVTPQKAYLRTISFSGEVKADRECATDSLYPRQCEVKAWADSGDAVLFDDFETLKLGNLAANALEAVLPVQELRFSHLSWLSPTEALVVISTDDSEANTWANTIARLNLGTKQLEKLHQGINLFMLRLSRCALSPDHRYFAFVDEASADVHWDELKLLDLQTRQVETLVPGKEVSSLMQMCWSPDGTRIAYACSERTGYAPGRSPEEQEKLMNQLKADKDAGTLDPQKVQEFMNTLSGPLYKGEYSINIMTLNNKQSSKLMALPEEGMLRSLQFLGNDRLMCHLEDRDHSSVTLQVYSLKDGKLERELKEDRGCRALATAAGKHILLDTGF